MTAKRSTEDLIRELAASPAPPAVGAAAILGAVCVAMMLALALFWMAFGLRSDLAQAIALLPAQIKMVLPFVLSVTAAGLALGSAVPGRRVALWPLALPVVVGVGMVMQRLAQIGDGPLRMEVMGKTALGCVTSITLMALLPLAVGLLLLQRTAPTRPWLTGALLGLATGAGIASGYALHCTEDSPLFFVPWYGLAIAIITVTGSVLGSRLLRW